MSVVIFDPEKFRLTHPAFTDEVKYPDEALENAFNLAVELIGNDDDSPIPYEPDATPPQLTRAVVLDLVTCHIATQNLLWDDTQTGPVTNATEGPRNVGLRLGRFFNAMRQARSISELNTSIWAVDHVWDGIAYNPKHSRLETAPFASGA